MLPTTNVCLQVAGTQAACHGRNAIDRLKKFEFALRRKTENGNDSLSLSGSDQVPDGFRQAIEEYYRSLGKKQQQ